MKQRQTDGAEQEGERKITHLYNGAKRWAHIFGTDFCLGLFRARFVVQVVGIVVVGAYTFQAYRANQLTREAITLNQRPILIPTIQREFFVTEDWNRLQTFVNISDEGKSPTLYWGAARMKYSEERVAARRMVFPTNGDGLAATSPALPVGLARQIAIGKQSGWLYVGIWLWYDRFHIFICREYKLPMPQSTQLSDSKQCSDPNSNYAD